MANNKNNSSYESEKVVVNVSLIDEFEVLKGILEEAMGNMENIISNGFKDFEVFTRDAFSSLGSSVEELKLDIGLLPHIIKTNDVPTQVVEKKDDTFRTTLGATGAISGVFSGVPVIGGVAAAYAGAATVIGGIMDLMGLFGKDKKKLSVLIEEIQSEYDSKETLKFSEILKYRSENKEESSITEKENFNEAIRLFKEFSKNNTKKTESDLKNYLSLNSSEWFKEYFKSDFFDSNKFVEDMANKFNYNKLSIKDNSQLLKDRDNLLYLKSFIDPIAKGLNIDFKKMENIKKKLESEEFNIIRENSGKVIDINTLPKDEQKIYTNYKNYKNEIREQAESIQENINKLNEFGKKTGIDVSKMIIFLSGKKSTLSTIANNNDTSTMNSNWESFFARNKGDEMYFDSAKYFEMISKTFEQDLESIDSNLASIQQSNFDTLQNNVDTMFLGYRTAIENLYNRDLTEEQIQKEKDNIFSTYSGLFESLGFLKEFDMQDWYKTFNVDPDSDLGGKLETFMNGLNSEITTSLEKINSNAPDKNGGTNNTSNTTTTQDTEVTVNTEEANQQLEELDEKILNISGKKVEVNLSGLEDLEIKLSDVTENGDNILDYYQNIQDKITEVKGAISDLSDAYDKIISKVSKIGENFKDTLSAAKEYYDYIAGKEKPESSSYEIPPNSGGQTPSNPTVQSASINKVNQKFGTAKRNISTSEKTSKSPIHSVSSRRISSRSVFPVFPGNYISSFKTLKNIGDKFEKIVDKLLNKVKVLNNATLVKNSNKTEENDTPVIKVIPNMSSDKLAEANYEIQKAHKTYDRWRYDDPFTVLINNFKNFKSNGNALEEKIYELKGEEQEIDNIKERYKKANEILDQRKKGKNPQIQESLEKEKEANKKKEEIEINIQSIEVKKIQDEIDELRKALEVTFNDLAESLGMGISSITGSIEEAMNETSYLGFINKFSLSLEKMTKQALIKAFISQSVSPIVEKMVKEFIGDEIYKNPYDAIKWGEELNSKVNASGIKEFMTILQSLYGDLDSMGSGFGGSSAISHSITEETGNRLASLFSTMNLHVASIDNVLNYGTLKVEVINFDTGNGFTAQEYMAYQGV